VIGHGAACDFCVASANGLVNLSMGVGRVAQIAIGRARSRGATPFLVERSDHLDQRGHDRVARRRGDDPVEIDVVHEEHLPIVE
jgi:hypothetical protein